MRVQRTGTGLTRPFRIISGATGRLAVTAGHLDQVQVGGALIPAGEQGVTVLPGRYTVQVPPTDPLFAARPAAPAHVDVPADQHATPAALQLPVQIRPDVVDQVSPRSSPPAPRRTSSPPPAARSGCPASSSVRNTCAGVSSRHP
jgi:hypothetical protein